MTPSRLLLAFALLSAAVPAAAQQPAEPYQAIAPGTRVRVSAPLALDAKRMTGTLVSIDRAQLVVIQDGFTADLPVRVAIPKLDRIEVSRGRVSGREGMRRGALTGALEGAGTGLFFAAVFHHLGPGIHDFGIVHGNAFAVFGGGFAALGTLIGAETGMRGYERWHVVHVPGQEVALQPIVDGRHAGVAVAVGRARGESRNVGR
ncbi:MAG: hypothetical protein JWM27_444 [Gemmatimonadetes bacterium]|nr:hypothetical protein [Gemmatimonadota bacterium]